MVIPISNKNRGNFDADHEHQICQNKESHARGHGGNPELRWTHLQLAENQAVESVELERGKKWFGKAVQEKHPLYTDLTICADEKRVLDLLVGVQCEMSNEKKVEVSRNNSKLLGFEHTG